MTESKFERGYNHKNTKLNKLFHPQVHQTKQSNGTTTLHIRIHPCKNVRTYSDMPFGSDRLTAWKSPGKFQSPGDRGQTPHQKMFLFIPSVNAPAAVGTPAPLLERPRTPLHDYTITLCNAKNVEKHRCFCLGRFLQKPPRQKHIQKL